jgi:hypothetical protein
MARTGIFRILFGINIIAILYFASRNLNLLKTCGGLLNPWLLVDALSCLVIPILLIYAFFLVQTQGKLGILIFIVNAIFLLLSFSSFKFGKLGFLIQRPWYVETTQLMETGQIRTLNRLPYPYRLLTACGQIIRQKESNVEYIFFFTEIDYLDFSGYLHSTNGSLPPEEFFSRPFLLDSRKLCTPIEKTWFICHYSD